MDDQIYAEDVNYWKTSKKTSADTWLDKAVELIEQFGGTVNAAAYGKAGSGSAYMIGFSYGDEKYKIIFPILPSKTGNEKAARVQSATLLYYDVKAKILTARILGVRTAFFSYLMLPDGRTLSQISTPKLGENIPTFLLHE